jgi:hypothetical protein
MGVLPAADLIETHVGNDLAGLGIEGVRWQGR